MKLRAWILLGISAIAMTLWVSKADLQAGSATQDELPRANVQAESAELMRKVPLALSGTELLEQAEGLQGVDGNPADMIDWSQYDQIKRYFLGQIDATPAKRERLWDDVNFSSIPAYELSVKKHRQDLRKLLGLVELNPAKPVVSTLWEGSGVRIENVEISLKETIGEFGMRALVFVPEDREREAAVIAIPQANQSPEDFAGIDEGMTTAPWLQMLLGRGVAVAIPEMVERRADNPIDQGVKEYDRRRILWRLGFIVGRTLVGIEVQQVMALRDYLASQPEINGKRIGVWGYGQGGMTALYAAAVDKKLAGATVLDYFEQREECWKEPVDRVIYGQLNEFGDAEVAALIAPRPLTIVTRWGEPIDFESVRAELTRARHFYDGLGAGNKLMAKEEASGAEEASAIETASMLGAEGKGKLPEIAFQVSRSQILTMRNEHFEELYRYLRGICAASGEQRRAYWKLNSTPPQEREQKVAMLRKELSRLVGNIPTGTIPPHPQTLLIGVTDKFLAYEVLLDVLPGVKAYGQLLVPRSVAGLVNKRLPAMICQHGFGAAPKVVTGVGSHPETGERLFGERLAERGYVVFAPYVTVPNDPQPPASVHRADLINPIVRMAAALGMMRTSIELAKLHCIVDFLQSLPFVNGKRIGYYGLSYGGYSALWMPPLEPRLKFTIISAYFNDRREMLTHVNQPDEHRDYWSLPDEDFYNWNLLNRFTDSELVAAMWPRPVCIEWGLYDTTTTPAWHRQAWAEVKKFADGWDMDDKIVGDDFVGPHGIHGIGTFFFIDRWLRPERSAERDYGCDDENYCNKDVAPGFYGYVPSSENSYVTHELNSSKQSAIVGRFYVSDVSPQVKGLALKLSRVGDPGDLVVDLGSTEGGKDLGELRLAGNEVSQDYGLWYNLKLKRLIRLDPGKLYWFDVSALPGITPQSAYIVYGPKPLGGEDYPHNFGLSFRVLTKGNE